jgi:hypothetical protein
MDPRFYFVIWLRRSLRWAGVSVGIVLQLGRNRRLLPAARQGMTAIETQQWLLDNGTRIRISMAIYLVCGGFYIPWCIAVSRVVPRVEGRVQS